MCFSTALLCKKSLAFSHMPSHFVPSHYLDTTHTTLEGTQPPVGYHVKFGEKYLGAVNPAAYQWFLLHFMNFCHVQVKVKFAPKHFSTHGAFLIILATLFRKLNLIYNRYLVPTYHLLHAAFFHKTLFLRIHLLPVFSLQVLRDFTLSYCFKGTHVTAIHFPIICVLLLHMFFVGVGGFEELFT